jgi:hypothetical protein
LAQDKVSEASLHCHFASLLLGPWWGRTSWPGACVGVNWLISWWTQGRERGMGWAENKILPSRAYPQRHV